MLRSRVLLHHVLPPHVLLRSQEGKYCARAAERAHLAGRIASAVLPRTPCPLISSCTPACSQEVRREAHPPHGYSPSRHGECGSQRPSMSTPAVGQHACTVRQGRVNGTRHILCSLTLYTKNPSVLLQLINRVCQGLLVRLDVAPDVAVTLVAGGLAGVMDPFRFGELT
jgi:hypothetical protein